MKVENRNARSVQFSLILFLCRQQKAPSFAFVLKSFKKVLFCMFLLQSLAVTEEVDVERKSHEIQGIIPGSYDVTVSSFRNP